MKRINKELIENIKNIDVSEIINDPQLVQGTLLLLINTIETMYSAISEMEEEIQEYRDEIALIKGEKGKPNIKPKKADKEDQDKEDEDKKDDKQNDRKDNIEMPKSKPWSKGRKKEKIKIDKEEIIKIDKTELPDDAEFKGYEEKIIQDVIITSNNILYKREKYYSASEQKTYTAELPEELRGTSYGIDIKALCIVLYFEYRVTENKIINFFKQFGITMSAGTLSNIIIKEKAEIFKEEKSAIYGAGLNSTIYQQTDDTGFRFDGQNWYMQVVCNPYYSAYFINERKNRDTAKEVLLNGHDELVFDIVLSDDAGQFKKIADHNALCWIHEYRHYKKIKVVFKIHSGILNNFKGQIKLYYDKLKEYKERPTESFKKELSAEFDKMFGTPTGYDVLDERNKLTMKKKEELLLVLDFPELPLHNNLSEGELREEVVKRKISFGTRTEEGSSAWENHFTILATCKKMGVNYYDYIKDIFSGKRKMPRLADLIKKASQMQLQT